MLAWRPGGALTAPFPLARKETVRSPLSALVTALRTFHASLYPKLKKNQKKNTALSSYSVVVGGFFFLIISA